ncbi:MAG: aminopeptidase P family protein [Rhizobiales bacterium]|nr:aminopeptidase P family protein [Hyphomicrobiales bacterium]
MNTEADHHSRLKALRTLMKAKGLAAVVVPRQDEFQGEYVAPYAERLKWLTGFMGSWGIAIVHRKKAAIFVDGRYTLQVRQQTDTSLFEPHHLMEDPPTAWLSRTLRKNEKLGFDPWVTTVSEARRLKAAAEAAGARLVALPKNPIDMIWKDQPARPSQPVEAHDMSHAGLAAAEKLKTIAASLVGLKADAVLLADPASVCWALNIRGSDVPYTPFPLAYALAHRKGKAELFVDGKRLTSAARSALKAVAVSRDPGTLADRLASLKGKTVALDPGLAPEAARLALLKAGARVIEAPDPCVLPKARKNETEQDGARAAQRRDGAALVRFLHWVAKNGEGGGLTEATAAGKLLELRSQSNLLRGLSFESISASGPNAAIPHYHLSPETARPLRSGEIYLIDSGGQYPDGTTDVTRTVMIGQPTDEMRDRFTRVLKGMIGISVLRFPKGTTGAHIDAIARAALWKAGLDFDHGTGHGVGSYLSVHEGPARISKAGHTPLEPGMILSNEPGYYKQDAYGIRIENLLLVTAATAIAGGDRPMLGFETLTFAPIDRNLIDTKLLTREELAWLDQYHARVERELAPQLDADTAAWLKEACAPLT